MNAFITLPVKCPICHNSLMDKSKKVDNEPSIHLIIESNGKRGNIWLSSVYDSFNYETDLELQKQEVVAFYCPLCKKNLELNQLCEKCKAPMIGLLLDIGGKVSFCSRNGCTNHIFAFDNLTNILKNLYQDYGLRGKHDIREEIISPIKTDYIDVEEEHKEVIKTGDFLPSYCPHCKKSLIEDDQLKMKLVKDDGEEGFVMLSPYFNVFTTKSTIHNPENTKAKDLKCFHCDKSLIEKDKSCEWCGSSIAKILVTARSKFIDFYFCSKKGCHWHGISDEDLNDIRLENSLEW